MLEDSCFLYFLVILGNLEETEQSFPKITSACDLLSDVLNVLEDEKVELEKSLQIAMKVQHHCFIRHGMV